MEDAKKKEELKVLQATSLYCPSSNALLVVLYSFYLHNVKRTSHTPGVAPSGWWPWDVASSEVESKNAITVNECYG